jgi:hypothetical protein
MKKQRPPTAREAEALETLARERWAVQVRHTMGLLRAENTDLDEKMTALAQVLAEERRPKKARVSRRKKRRKTGASKGPKDSAQKVRPRQRA